MGIYYSAAIVVGIIYDDVPEDKKEAVDDLIEEEKLLDFPPYYDGGKQGVVGLEYKSSGTFSPVGIAFDDEKVGALKHQFYELTGLKPKLYLTPRGG